MNLDILANKIDEPLRIIYTNGVKLVETGIIVGMKMPEPAIILITGEAGLGKTKSIEHFVSQLDPQVHTGLRPCEMIVISHNPTRLSLPKDILEHFDERPQGGDSKSLTKQIIQVLRDNEISLLILDEGNRLNNDSFEVLKTLHDAAVNRKMNCRVAIVGLPSIIDLIRRHEQFDSRAPMHVEMPPLDETEVINDFLPKLDIPRWRFDPIDRIDQELGKLLWRHTQPSLRRLVTWISIAVVLAEIDGMDWVTLANVDDAAKLLRFVPKEYEEVDAYKGVHERISELRHAYKELIRSKRNSGK